MAGIREIRAIGPSAQLSDRKASAQRTVNMYLSATESVGEDKQFILRSVPGGASSVTCSGELRGMCTAADGETLFFVDGDKFKAYTTGAASEFTDVSGGLTTSTGAVRMALGSGGKVVVVDGTTACVADTGASSIAPITDADFVDTSTQVEYLDGYWILNGTGEQFYISALDDPTSYSALDFTSADREPDNVIALRVARSELYVFGSRSTEIWYNSGNADFPFSRYTQAPIDIGIVGGHAACKTTDSLAFVGRAKNGAPMVYLFNGHTPRRISNRAVEEALLALDPGPGSTSYIDLVRVWSYQSPGGEFIGIDMPTPGGPPLGLGSTFVFEINSGQWHERRALSTNDTTLWSLGSIDVQTHRGRPHMGLYFYKSDGTPEWRIFELDESEYDWGGRALYRERTWPHLVAPTAEPVRYASLELMCTTGSASGTVSLEISNDGGATFGTAQSKTISASDVMQRIRWLFLGQSRDRVFRISCSSDVPFNIHGAQVEAG